MKLKILGTRGEISAFSRRHRRHSGMLIDGKILLDLGEEEYLAYKPGAIFVTHLHPDHAVFIRKPLATKIPVYAPEKDAAGTVSALVSKPVRIGRYRITPIPTHHSMRVKSQAYKVSDGRDAVLYTGDVVWIDKKYHALFEGVKLVVTDGSYLRKGGFIRKDKKTGKLYGHNGIPDLIRLFKPFTRHILLTHFGSWFFEDEAASTRRLLQLGREHGVKIHIGFDAMEIDTDEL